MPVLRGSHSPPMITPARFAVPDPGGAGGPPEEGNMIQPPRPGLDAVTRIHRRYGGTIPTPVRRRIIMLRAIRDLRGLGGRRPDAAEKLEAHIMARDWDGQAQEDRNRREPYQGSRYQGEHRRNRNWNARTETDDAQA